MNITPTLKLSRIFFALAIVALGLLHFIFKDFITGRPPKWPEGLPGQYILAYLSGAILIVTGLAIFANQRVKLALLVTGSMILLWAGLRNLTGLVTTLDNGILLTTTNKALTFGFGIFLVAATFTNKDEPENLVNRWINRLAPIARYVIGFFLLASGVQHFLFADFVKFLIPTWIPAATFWVYFSGVALIAGGLGILTGIKGQLAAALSGWMVFTWLIVLHIPRAISAIAGAGNEWIGVFEALAVSGLLFVLANQKR